MKTYILIIIGAALLAACEQKTETVAPATSPTAAPEAANTAEPVTSPRQESAYPATSSPTPTP